MDSWLKKNGIHLGIIAFFIIICFAYFSPVLQGKTPKQGDVLQAKAMQREIMAYKAKEGKGPLWTNQMFGGMPAYQIWVQYPKNIATYGIALIKQVLPDPVGTVLLYLVGAYILFCALRVPPLLSAAGAIAFAFTSYNFIILAAGHSNKALAIGVFAPVLAGIFLIFRKKYWWGMALLALSMALELRANHIQMTYYLMLAVLPLLVIELYHDAKAGNAAAWGKKMAFAGGAMLIALLVNASLLLTTYEYGKETIRGKANLTPLNTEESGNGLTKDYAYQWSQGVGESFTFLVPNLYGGASGVNELAKPERESYKQVQQLTGGQVAPEAALQQLGAAGYQQYWGDKPGTSGPYYLGAVICFLFVFSAVLLRSRWKWWVLGTSAVLLLLSFGKNFTAVSDLFFNYVPLYNKFRAVESILAVVTLLVPFLAILGVAESRKEKYDTARLRRSFYWALGITGGFTLLMIIMPKVFFGFTGSNYEALRQNLQQMTQNAEMTNNLLNALVADRISIARADAIRTLIYIILAAGAVWLAINKKLKYTYLAIILGVLVLADMWGVDKRYMNEHNFVSKGDLMADYAPRQIDEFIMADKDPYYRVLDLSEGYPWSNNRSSYFYKTVNGFHSARLMRFQELIDRQLVDKNANPQEIYQQTGDIKKAVAGAFAKNGEVLNMLNTRYIIYPGVREGEISYERNSGALGNAWFVDKVQFEDNAEKEMDVLGVFDPKVTAVINKQYGSQVDAGKVAAPAAGDTIALSAYHPDRLEYTYTLAAPRVAVFSEIWYDKGWKMYVDGAEKPFFRTDYLLRGALLPAGKHKVEFKFIPASYYGGEWAALAGSVLLLGAFGLAVRQRRNVTPYAGDVINK